MKKKNIGSSFDDFLREDGIYEEVTAAAIKRVLALQIDHKMEQQHLPDNSDEVLSLSGNHAIGADSWNDYSVKGIA